MSVLRSRSSLTPAKVFLLSGLSGEERKDLSKKITLLGGKYFHVEDFKAHCTHVVCGKLTRSEKFLGACATGKWVLHPDYILQSMVAKDWLDEEQFEWCDDHIAAKMTGVIPLDLAYASRRWRFMLGDQNGAFTGWKVAVVVGANRSKALKRLLISGGAEVFNMKIPIKNPEKVANSIGYIFVSEQNVAAVAHLLEYGVLCIRPEFIGDYLIKDPPADPMDYLVQVGANNGSGPTFSQGNGEAPSFLMSSQIGLPLSEPSSEIDGNILPSTSQQEPNELNDHMTGNDHMTAENDHVTGNDHVAAENDHVTAELNDHVIAEEDCFITLVIESHQSQASNTVSKTKAVAADISEVKSAIVSSQDLAKPGPSGAASQTGSQKHTENVLKSGVLNSHSENQLGNSSRQRTPAPGISSLPVTDAVMNSDDSKKKLTPMVNNSNLKKAKDESKVKRTREKKANALKEENNTKVYLSESENDMNVKNLMKSLSDTTGETPQIRMSGRLKHHKSEPVWKDLVPKKRSSTEKTDLISKKRSSTEKIEELVSKKRSSTEKIEHLVSKKRSSTEKIEDLVSKKRSSTEKIEDLVSKKRSSTEKEQNHILKERSSTEKEENGIPKQRSSTEKEENGIPKQRSSTEKEENGIPKQRSSTEKEENGIPKQRSSTEKEVNGIPKQRSSTEKEVNGIPKQRSSTEKEENGIPKQRSSTEKGVNGIPKQRSSTEKEENGIPKQRSLTKKEENGIPKQRSLTEKEETGIPKHRSLTEKEETGIPKHRSLTEKEDTKEGTDKVLTETMVKIADNEIPDCVVVKIEHGVSTAKDNHLFSSNLHSSENSSIHQNMKLESKLETVSKPKAISEIHKTNSIIEEQNKCTRRNNGKVVEKEVKGDISQINWSEKTKTDNILPSSSVKKKRSRQYADLQSILKDIKRQKVSHCVWRPTVFALDPSPEAQGDAMIMPMTLTEIIHSSLEEKLSQQTAILDDLSSKITGKYMPQSKTLHAIMVNLLLGARTDLEANKAYQVLMKILHLHPPTSPGVQEVYRKSLCTVDSSGMDEGEIAQGADWILLKGCIGNIITECLSSDSINSQTVRNSELLLKYLLCLIEQDLQHLMKHHHHIQEIWSPPLLLRVLWSPSYHVVLNNKCRELLDLMSEVLIYLRTNVLTEQKERLLKILKTVVWLVAVATECSRLSEGGSPEGLAALQCEKNLAFVHEVAQRITTADMTDTTILQVIFSALQLPWQCVGVSQQLLNNMDDYLLADEQVRDLSKITLSHIVSRYFFLLPKFNMRAERITRSPDSPAKRQRNLINSKSKKNECLGETSTNSAENIAKLTGKINKKNSKGETPLHTACIKNDLNKLKQLLKTPGIDVNVKDNAGWTPLHEACNHGNIQCVQELLKFVPAKTMEHYFKKDSLILRKVDLLAKTEEGITPLHDAVLNNRTEVCRMLLQHGGHKLLSAVTCLDYTPLQLAETDEMYSLLSSYLPPPRRVSDSQEFSFSQDSMMSMDETRTDLPPDHLYDEVTMNGDTRIFPDKHALLTYIYLVTCLLKNYIKAIDAEMIREKIREKVNLAKSRHKLYMDWRCQNRESSQEIERQSQSSQYGFLPSSQPGHQQSSQEGCPISSQESDSFTPTENIPFSLSQGGESSDKENKRCPFRDKNNFASSSGVTRRNSSEIKSDSVDNRVNKAYVRGIKRDLKVLKGLQKHVDMFQTHLERICAKDDTQWIEMELLEISVLVDNFLS